MNKGASLQEQKKVNPADCISAIDARLPALLGTYTIVKWMEITAAKLAQASLDKNHITVGQNINITHTGMVAEGEKVTIEAIFLKQQKRNLLFKTTAFTKKEIIAQAEHTRIIVPKRIIERQLKNR